MEDGNKSFGSGGAQRSAPHSRPFFYVQPPTQPPYYLYQHWQMGHPYGPYAAAALPGGFNLGRPCLPPYQYLQYPGFMFPQAPVYPLDYRRAFEPRLQPPAWHQLQHQYHQQYQNQNQYLPPQPPQPETASSEVQTEPSDAISKLIECLDKIRAGERELDSGVASQSSGMFSPEEEKKSEEASAGAGATGGGGVLSPALPGGSPMVVFSDSTTAVYDAESSHRSLDVLSPQGCWSGALEEEEGGEGEGEEEGAELPLDSSSLHEDGPDPDPHQVLQPKEPQEPESRTSHRILRLPFERILTPGGGGGGTGRLSSPSAAAAAAAPYIYNYLSLQPTHERMSVLSPSLDELSSRDEMFSTDLDDVDLFPKHVYAARRSLAQVVGVSPEEPEELLLPGSRKFMCACCGKHLAKGAGAGSGAGGAGGRSKVVYRDEGGDSEDEGRYEGEEEPLRLVVRRHSTLRKSAQSGPVRQKPWHHRRGHYKNQEEGHDLCKPDAGGGATAAEQCRSCDERVGRAEPSPQEKNRWGDKEPGHRRRLQQPGGAAPRQELSSQRKVMLHRPRDLEEQDDDEEPPPPPPLHWDRGSNLRADPRC